MVVVAKSRIRMGSSRVVGSDACTPHGAHRYQRSLLARVFRSTKSDADKADRAAGFWLSASLLKLEYHLPSKSVSCWSGWWLECRRAIPLYLPAFAFGQFS